MRVPAFLPDTPEVRSDVADYLAEVERFDCDLGELVAALERAGELERTVLIVTSDNGMPFPAAKATLYDGGTRVPLVIRGPAWRVPAMCPTRSSRLPIWRRPSSTPPGSTCRPT